MFSAVRASVLIAVSISFFAVAEGFTAEAQVQSRMPPEDQTAARSALQFVLRDFINRIEAYDSPNGKGEVITKRVISPSQLTCPQFQCPDPCRNFEYTYTGKDLAQNAITETYAGQACRNTIGNWEIQSEGLVSSEIIVAAAPAARPVTPQPVAVAAPAPQPALPEYSRAKATRAQELLANLYYYEGTLDGDFGPGSQNALKSFLADEAIAWSTYPVTDQLLDDVIARAELALSR